MLKEGNIRIPSGCAISGLFNKSGKNINGRDIIKSISIMHDRSNGLGGGFAGYGIYPIIIWFCLIQKIYINNFIHTVEFTFY